MKNFNICPVTDLTLLTWLLLFLKCSLRKNSPNADFFVLCFALFGLDTVVSSVNVHIQSKYWKIQTRKLCIWTLVFDGRHAFSDGIANLLLCEYSLLKKVICYNRIWSNISRIYSIYSISLKVLFVKISKHETKHLYIISVRQ